MKVVRTEGPFPEVSQEESTMLVGFCAGLGSTFPSDISVEVPKYKDVISKPYRLSTASRPSSSSLNALVVPDLVGMYAEKMHVGWPDVSSWMPTIL